MPVGKSAQPLRALVVGAGPGAVAMHLPLLARLRDQGRVALVSVCDLEHGRASTAQAQFGFQEYTTDARTALARPDLDLVYLFGAAQLHYEYGLVALEHGRHLFVEKPIAPSFEQARELAARAALARLVAVGGLNRRFYPALQRVRAAGGRAGWRLAEAVFHKPEAGRPPPFGARTWLSANGIHALDALVYMMGGLPERLVAASAGAPPSCFSALMSWSDGRQGMFLSDNDAGARREEYIFHGVGESYTVADSGLTIARGDTLTQVPMPGVGAGLLEEHEAFLQAIGAATAPPHSLAAIAPSLFLCELIESGFSGPVRLPSAPSVPARAPAPLPQAVVGMSAPTVLVSQPAALHQALLRLAPGWRLSSVEEVRASPTPRPDIAAALLGRGSEGLTTEVLEKLPRLQIVGVAGLSLAPYGAAELLSRNVAIVNASEAYAQSVAEFALGLAIVARRRGFASHEIMRRGGWGTGAPTPGVKGAMRRLARKLRPLGAAVGLQAPLLRAWRAAQPLVGAPGYSPQPQLLRGASVGLIGWGASARAFAQLLCQAQARVLVYSEHADAAELAAAGVGLAALADVLAADVVSLHRGLTPATQHFLGAAELARLRPGAVLINVARGGLIEPAALLARLRHGDVFACLDTYEAEPLAVTDPLRALPNVFLTSHLGGGSAAMHAAAAEEVVAKVAAYLNGGQVTSISSGQLATMT